MTQRIVRPGSTDCSPRPNGLFGPTQRNVRPETMDPYRFLWIPMDSYGILWNPMDSYGFLWFPMDSDRELLHMGGPCRGRPGAAGTTSFPIGKQWIPIGIQWFPIGNCYIWEGRVAAGWAIRGHIFSHREAMDSYREPMDSYR